MAGQQIFSRYSDGRQTPMERAEETIEGTKGESLSDALRHRGYGEFFSLGGEDMGSENDPSDLDTPLVWQGDVSAVVWALDGSDARKPIPPGWEPYCVVLESALMLRVVFCPTLTDMFAFCNLIAPVLRLNYETSALAERGTADVLRRQRLQERIEAAREQAARRLNGATTLK